MGQHYARRDEPKSCAGFDPARVTFACVTLAFNMSNPAWAFERLHFDNDAYFDALLEAIDRAKKTVDIEMYIFNPDELGRLMETHLESAARRGVRVRVLI